MEVDTFTIDNNNPQFCSNCGFEVKANEDCPNGCNKSKHPPVSASVQLQNVFNSFGNIFSPVKEDTPCNIVSEGIK